jgi:hypothetical protein
VPISAAVALDGVVEFGAVNCDKAHELCSAQGIKSFPKFLLYSPRYEWSEEYPKDRLKELGKPKDAMGEDIVEWVRDVLPPFAPGFAHMLGGGSVAAAAAQEGVLSGRDQLISWPGSWLLLCVAGHDAARCQRCDSKATVVSRRILNHLSCGSCNAAKPNILRLAGDLAAIEAPWDASAPAGGGMRVGIVDCTDAVMGELCRELGPSVSTLNMRLFAFR